MRAGRGAALALLPLGAYCRNPLPKVTVDARRALADTGPAYIGYTTDYHSNTGQPDPGRPAGQNWGPTSSILSMPLGDPRLRNVAAGLAGRSASARATWRIGGDTHNVVYEVGGAACDTSWEACLSMERWVAIFQFAQAANTRVVFTLNGMRGRLNKTHMDPDAPWDPSNTEALLRYTHARGLALYAVGLGNELSNRNMYRNRTSCGDHASQPGTDCPPMASPRQYGEDLWALKQLLDSIWADAPTERPLLVAPDAGWAQNLDLDFMLQWWQEMLPVGGAAIDRVAYHLYIDGWNDANLTQHLISLDYLGRLEPQFAARLEPLLAKHAPRALAAGLWCDETGSAWGSGARGVTDRFADVFWYAHQLGTFARMKHTVFARQTLRGGWYELINQTTYSPFPDYWVAAMHANHAGSAVLQATVNGTNELSAFAYCAPKPWKGGVTVMLVHPGDSEISVDIEGVAGMHLDGVLAPGYGGLSSSTALYNGKPLELGPNGTLPQFHPRHSPPGLPFGVQPRSVSFLVYPDAAAGACSG